MKEVLVRIINELNLILICKLLYNYYFRVMKSVYLNNKYKGYIKLIISNYMWFKLFRFSEVYLFRMLELDKYWMFMFNGMNLVGEVVVNKSIG